jgi:hypothetical protein
MPGGVRQRAASDLTACQASCIAENDCSSIDFDASHASGWSCVMFDSQKSSADIVTSKRVTDTHYELSRCHTKLNNGGKKWRQTTSERLLENFITCSVKITIWIGSTTFHVVLLWSHWSECDIECYHLRSIVYSPCKWMLWDLNYNRLSLLHAGN